MSRFKHIRGWARPSIRHSAASQVAALTAYGCAEVYTDGAEPWAALINSLRRGEAVAVTSMARLANSRAGIRSALADLDAAGLVLIETSTGRQSDDPVQRGAMILDAVDELAQDRRAFTPAEARKAAKRSWRDRRVDRTADAEARKAWGDVVHYRTNADALSSEHMRGWSLRMAYMRLGKRGTTLGGRPRKRKP